jgi:hypothetical protein
VAGIVFTPSGTLTGLRVGISLTNAILAVGVAILGWAAWQRVSELVTGHAQRPIAPRRGWTIPGRRSSAPSSAAEPTVALVTEAEPQAPQDAPPASPAEETPQPSEPSPPSPPPEATPPAPEAPAYAPGKMITPPPPPPPRRPPPPD